MSPHTFRQLERLQISLTQLTCEIRFVTSVIGVESQRLLEIDSEDALVVLTQIVRQLQVAQRIAKSLFETN